MALHLHPTPQNRKLNSIHMISITTPDNAEKTNESKSVNSNARGKFFIEKIGLFGGLITCVFLIIYLMIMKNFNLLQSEIAWASNTLILGAGIMLTYRHFRSKTELNVDYLPGLILGIITTASSVIPYVLFLLVWLSQANAEVLQDLKHNALFMGGTQITALKAAISTMIEGTCSGVIISFMMMQYYKSGFKTQSKDGLQHG